jgi:hypothetical protein
VDDVDSATKLMEHAGHAVHHRIVTPGGTPKVQMGVFHGAPTLLYSVAAGKTYIEAVTGRNLDQARHLDYSPAIAGLGTPE